MDLKMTDNAVLKSSQASLQLSWCVFSETLDTALWSSIFCSLTAVPTLIAPTSTNIQTLICWRMLGTNLDAISLEMKVIITKG